MREGWLSKTGEEIASKITKGSSPKWQGFDYQPSGVLFVTSENVRDGYLDISEPKFLPESFNEKAKGSRLLPGDILINIVGASIGRTCMFDLNGVAANVNQAVCVFRLKPQHDPHFFTQLFQAPHIQHRLLGQTSDSARPNLSLADFREFCFEIPPLAEQRRIATILMGWDRAIGKLASLRTAKLKRLTCLRAELLFGNRRLGEPCAIWPLRRLGEVTRELSKRNNKLTLDRSAVMGVSNSRGIVPMREQTVADDISRYKLLPPAGFAYNPMRINVGSIAMNKHNTTFLVSPDYVAFTCNPDGLEPEYLDHLRQTRWWLHHINAGGSGSVRQRTYYDDLAALQLRLPDIEEQRAIVAVLNAAATDVELTDREIAALGRQKRGLMQKLLTGEWPVKVEDAK